MTPEQRAKAIEDAAQAYADACIDYEAENLQDFSNAVQKAREAMQSAIRAGVGAAPEGWLSLDELDMCRQWFDSIQDTNGGYLNPADYALAAKLYERQGLRVPHSISNVLAAAPKP